MVSMNVQDMREVGTVTGPKWPSEAPWEPGHRVIARGQSGCLASGDGSDGNRTFPGRLSLSCPHPVPPSLTSLVCTRAISWGLEPTQRPRTHSPAPPQVLSHPEHRHSAGASDQPREREARAACGVTGTLRAGRKGSPFTPWVEVCCSHDPVSVLPFTVWV